jgi:hypothetical protein
MFRLGRQTSVKKRVSGRKIQLGILLKLPVNLEDRLQSRPLKMQGKAMSSPD